MVSLCEILPAAVTAEQHFHKLNEARRPPTEGLPSVYRPYAATLLPSRRQ